MLRACCDGPVLRAASPSCESSQTRKPSKATQPRNKRQQQEVHREACKFLLDKKQAHEKVTLTITWLLEMSLICVTLESIVRFFNRMLGHVISFSENRDSKGDETKQ